VNIYDLLPRALGEFSLAAIAVSGLYLAFKYWERVRALMVGEHRGDIIALNCAALAYCGLTAIQTLNHTADITSPFGLALAWLGWWASRNAWDGDKPPAYVRTKPAEFDDRPHHYAESE
jgi:hypothetical protein